MTAMEENVDDRFAGIDIDSLLSRSNPRPLNCGRRKALYESPEFIQRLNGEETVLEGQSLVLECKVAGFPVPVLRWFKDDEEIIDHPRIRVEGDGKGTYCLLIDSVHKGDEAAYRCRAENVEGTCSSCFFLSVKAKRRSQKKKRKKDSKSGTKRTVSFPPMFATIVEKVEEEEKQGKELELLPPSPMTDFYYALTLKGRQSWPAFLGDWAFVDASTHGLYSDNDARTSDENEPQNAEGSNDDEDVGPRAKKPFCVQTDSDVKDIDDTSPSNEVDALNSSSVNSDLEPKDIGQGEIVKRGRRYRRRRDLAAQRALHDQSLASTLPDATLNGNRKEDSSSNHRDTTTIDDSINGSSIAVPNADGQEADTTRAFRRVNVITSGVESASTPPIVVEMWDDDVDNNVSFGKTLRREEREATPFFNDQRLENTGKKLDIRNSRSPRGSDTAKNRSLNNKIQSNPNNLGIDVAKGGDIDEPDSFLSDSRTEFRRALTPIPMLEMEKVPCFSSGLLQLPDNDFTGVRAPRESTPFYEDSSPGTPSTEGPLDSSPTHSRSPSPSPTPIPPQHGHPHHAIHLRDNKQLLSPTSAQVIDYPFSVSSVQENGKYAAAVGDDGNGVGCKDGAGHATDSNDHQTDRNKPHDVTDRKRVSIPEIKELSLPEKKSVPPPALSLSIPDKKIHSQPANKQHFVPSKTEIPPPGSKVISETSAESTSSLPAVLSSVVSKSSTSLVPSTEFPSHRGAGLKREKTQKEAVMEVARPAIRYGSVERQVIQASPTASSNAKQPTRVDPLKDGQSHPSRKQAGAIDIPEMKVMIPEAISRQNVEQLCETKQEEADTEKVFMKLNDASNDKLGTVNQKYIAKQMSSNTQTSTKPTADTENANHRPTTTKIPIKKNPLFSTFNVKETQSREHGKLTPLATPSSKASVEGGTPTSSSTSQLLPTVRKASQFGDTSPTVGGVTGKQETGPAPLENMATAEISPTLETVPALPISRTGNPQPISDSNTAKGSTQSAISRTGNPQPISDSNTAIGSTQSDITTHRVNATPTATSTETPTKTSRSPRRTPLSLDTGGRTSRARASHDDVTKKTKRIIDLNVTSTNSNKLTLEANGKVPLLNVEQEKLKHPPPISTSEPSALLRSRHSDTANPPLSTARPHLSTSRSRPSTSSSTPLGASNTSSSGKEIKAPSTSGLKKLSSWIQQKQGHGYRKDNKGTSVEYGDKQRTRKSKEKGKTKGRLMVEPAKSGEGRTTSRMSRKVVDGCSPFGRYTVEGLGVLLLMTMFCLYVDTPVERFVAYVLASYYVFCVLRVLGLLR